MRSRRDGARRWTRREIIAGGLRAGAWSLAAGSGLLACRNRSRGTEVFIGRAPSYATDLELVVRQGLAELGIGAAEIRGKRVLLKPNLVEPRRGSVHVNTHPAVVVAAAAAFRSLGAASVIVGEGPGHRRDALLVLDESGLAEALTPERLPFVDLNNDDGFVAPNLGGRSGLLRLSLPVTLKRVDWIVSLAKMKTHHWAGITLSMKNLFGLMPGSFYGWPKNVLHFAGIEESILDLTASIAPQLAIVDGIVGMEGDGPILGTPKEAGVLILGRNLPAVDATCARVMGLNPQQIRYLREAAGWLGPIAEGAIAQRGEAIAAVRTPFALVETIPAHQGLADPAAAAVY